MLFLFCVDFDGSVKVKHFDSCADRDEFTATLVCSDYREVIEINGNFDFVDLSD
jgi:hypothetical protein